MNKKKIELTCIIDDDPIFVFGAKRIMERSGFCNSIIVFNNGQEALEGLKQIFESQDLNKVPDLILLDLNMPIMDGWSFLNHFIKITPPKKIKVYIVTSSVSSQDRERAKDFRERLEGYIIKPISRSKLMTILSGEKQPI